MSALCKELQGNDMKTRRQFLRATSAAAAGTALTAIGSTNAWATMTSSPHGVSAQAPGGPVAHLAIAKNRREIDGRKAMPTMVNNSLPGPIMKFREGDDVTIHVTNQLAEPSSIHWHGLLVPPEMDGVPGVSFDGIPPGGTFVYRFKLRQHGTYWYHSHSGNQEQAGLYGPLIIEPATPDPFKYDSECIVMLSDWTFEDPARVLDKMKKVGSYYNYNRRTVADLFRDASRDGWRTTLADRMEWAKMRMDPTDIADVTGFTYTYLLNGQSAAQNWTSLFRPGERIRIRFINAGAMTHFDVRIPGLEMVLVQADGQNVEPVTVDEFRIAPAETFDMIVQPRSEEAYTIFAEAMDRSGFVAGTLARSAGQRAPIPARRTRPLRTMADMGMSGAAMGGMAMPAAENTQGAALAQMASHASTPVAGAQTGVVKETPAMPGMDMPPSQQPVPAMPEMSMSMPPTTEKPGVVAQPGSLKQESAQGKPHGPDRHGAGNSTVAESPVSRINEAGSGLGDEGRRVLVYGDLRSLSDGYEGVPERELELHITGNMDRQIWGFDGKKYSEAKTPIRLELGQRLRITFINDTMMDHPMHLHGMWMMLENGAGARRPLKHTINVKPGERLSFDVVPDELGKWAFHCHLLFHMELGMFRVVAVVNRLQGELS